MMLCPLRTPAGVIRVAFSKHGIAGVILPVCGRKKSVSSGNAKVRPTFAQKKLLVDLGAQFKKYFSGKPYSFKNFPLDLSDCTAFQKEVLHACRCIPAGTTVSYRDLAREIHRGRAFRAVGNALGSNPLPILIPCHRVVRSGGELGGFTAGQGWKKRLLAADKEAAGLKVKS